MLRTTTYNPGQLDVTNTGNREPGTGVWEQVYSGNPPKNSKWWTKEKKREPFGEMRGSVTIVNMSFYRLCPKMTSSFLLEHSDWYWDKQGMKWHMGRKSNQYYHKLPQSICLTRYQSNKYVLVIWGQHFLTFP